VSEINRKTVGGKVSKRLGKTTPRQRRGSNANCSRPRRRLKHKWAELSWPIDSGIQNTLWNNGPTTDPEKCERKARERKSGKRKVAGKSGEAAASRKHSHTKSILACV